MAIKFWHIFDMDPNTDEVAEAVRNYCELKDLILAEFQTSTKVSCKKRSFLGTQLENCRYGKGIVVAKGRS